MGESRGRLRGVDLDSGTRLSDLLGPELVQHRRELEQEWDRLEGERRLEPRAVPAADLDARRSSGQVPPRWGRRDRYDYSLAWE